MGPITDRQRGILSKADREFLLGKKDDLEEQSKRNTRQRIRNRIKHGIRDFHLILRHLDTGENETISEYISRGNEIYQGLVAIVAFAFRLASHADIDRNEVVKKAILSNQPFASDVRVQIDYDVDPPIHPEYLSRQIHSGELPDPQSIGTAIGYGSLDQDDIDKLQELVEEHDEWGPGILKQIPSDDSD